MLAAKVALQMLELPPVPAQHPRVLEHGAVTDDSEGVQPTVDADHGAGRGQGFLPLLRDIDGHVPSLGALGDCYRVDVCPGGYVTALLESYPAYARKADLAGADADVPIQRERPRSPLFSALELREARPVRKEVTERRVEVSQRLLWGALRYLVQP